MPSYRSFTLPGAGGYTAARSPRLWRNALMPYRRFSGLFSHLAQTLSTCSLPTHWDTFFTPHTLYPTCPPSSCKQEEGRRTGTFSASLAPFLLGGPPAFR